MKLLSGRIDQAGSIVYLPGNSPHFSGARSTIDEVRAGRDLDYAELLAKHMDAKAAGHLARVERAPSYILYTSGTTGRPKACSATSADTPSRSRRPMKHIYCGGGGETMFTTSDIGGVVGHSYINLRSVIAGMTDDPVRGPSDPARSPASGGKSLRTLSQRDVSARRPPIPGA